MFWFYVFAVCLIPLTMGVIGYCWKKRPPSGPKKGYRTPLTLKSPLTWQFAHKYLGNIWLWMGKILLPVSLLAMWAFHRFWPLFASWCAVALVLIQVILMLCAAPLTRRQLLRRFDEDGRPLPPKDKKP